MVFGCEVRSRRMAKGWSLEELAARAGLTPNYLGALELGKRGPSLTTILALARALGVSPAELVDLPPPDLSAAAIELAQLLDGWPPDEPPPSPPPSPPPRRGASGAAAPRPPVPHTPPKEYVVWKGRQGAA